MRFRGHRCYDESFFRRQLRQRTGADQKQQRIITDRTGAESKRARPTGHAAVPVIRNVGHTGRVLRRRAVAAFPQETRRPDDKSFRGNRSRQHAGRADRSKRQAEDLSLALTITLACPMLRNVHLREQTQKYHIFYNALARPYPLPTDDAATPCSRKFVANVIIYISVYVAGFILGKKVV